MMIKACHYFPCLANAWRIVVIFVEFRRATLFAVTNSSLIAHGNLPCLSACPPVRLSASFLYLATRKINYAYNHNSYGPPSCASRLGEVAVEKQRRKTAVEVEVVEVEVEVGAIIRRMLCWASVWGR